MMSTIEL